jgi:hypothetical protein
MVACVTGVTLADHGRGAGFAKSLALSHKRARTSVRGVSFIGVTVPLAVGTGVVVIVIAIAVVLLVLIVALSLRQRRNARARLDLVEAHERAALAERDLEIAREQARQRADTDQ